MVLEGDLTWGVNTQHNMQVMDTDMENCMPEACVLVLTKVAPIHSKKTINIFRIPSVFTSHMIHSVIHQQAFIEHVLCIPSPAPGSGKTI